MHAFLIVSLLLGADGAQPLGNGRHFVDNDVTYKVEYDDGVVVTTTLSLQERGHFYEGKAWIIQMAEEGGQAFEWRAYKGTYNFYTSDEDNILLLKLGFVRKYVSEHRDQRLAWRLDRRFQPQGAELEISLDETHSIPSDEVDILIARGFFVDETGAETVKYYPPAGILQKIAGRGEVRRFIELDFGNVGTSMTVVPTYGGKLEKTAPPGFLPPGFRTSKRSVPAGIRE